MKTKVEAANPGSREKKIVKTTTAVADKRTNLTDIQKQHASN